MPSIDLYHGSLGDNGIYLPKLSSSPSTPPSGKGYVYAKTDNKLYVKNDAGTETELILTDDYVLVLQQDQTTTQTGSFVSAGFTLNLASSSVYLIIGKLLVRTSNDTSGYAIGLAYGALPSGATATSYSRIPSSTTATRGIFHSSADDTNQGTRAMIANTTFLAEVSVVITTTTNGSSASGWDAIRFNSGNAAATASILAGSLVQVIKIA